MWLHEEIGLYKTEYVNLSELPALRRYRRVRGKPTEARPNDPGMGASCKAGSGLVMCSPPWGMGVSIATRKHERVHGLRCDQPLEKALRVGRGRNAGTVCTPDVWPQRLTGEAETEAKIRERGWAAR